MFFAFLLLPVVAAVCPYGSTFYPDGNTCYLTSKLHVPWKAAESICQNLGGHLASIQNQQQNDFVYLGVETLGTPAWIGATHASGDWAFSDGSPVTFTNFLQKQSNSSEKKARAFMYGGSFNHQVNGKWGVAEDNKKTIHPFVCELPPCGSGVVPSSLLDTTSNDTGLVYGSVSNTWFFGNDLDATTFSLAPTLCKSAVGNLPSIRNAFENTQLLEAASTLLGSGVFPEIIIGYQSDITGHWSWSDNLNSSYTNWAKYEPVTSVNARSVLNLDSGYWHAKIDTLARLFLCEFPIPNGQTC